MKKVTSKEKENCRMKLTKGGMCLNERRLNSCTFYNYSSVLNMKEFFLNDFRNSVYRKAVI